MKPMRLDHAILAIGLAGVLFVVAASGLLMWDDHQIAKQQVSRSSTTSEASE